MISRLVAACLLLFALSAAAKASPTAFWVSDPVAPGQTVLVFGGGFAGCKSVHWERLPDKAAARAVSGDVVPLQVRPRSVKFVLPGNVPAGIFSARIETASGAATVFLDRPQVTWAQGDAGTPGTPGGWIRVCGKCLTAAGKEPLIRLSKGGAPITLKPDRAEPFTLGAKLPAALPPGDYMVRVSSGLGASSGWSDPAPFKVISRSALPKAIFNAPAPARDAAANSTALQAVIDQAGEHGGTVRLPAGRWLLAVALTIPPNVSLQGAGMDRTALCWADTPTPPTALITGTDHFSLSDLSLFADQYQNGVVADQKTPTAGYVHIDRVRMRLNRYRGHITPEEAAARYVQAIKISSGGGDALRLGGEDVEVSHCDIYCSGRPLFLSRASGVTVFDNHFYIGRNGWYCLSGLNGMLFERNTIEGADLMSGGGGMNTLDGTVFSQNAYFADNTIRNFYGGDHEGMTTDGPSGIYYGKIASVSGTALTLADDIKLPAWRTPSYWTGCGVFIMDGQGAGQYRRLKAVDGRIVTVDRPWAVAPDDTSLISITVLQRNYIMVGNSFTDTGVALQFYGSSICFIADGNTCARSAGYFNFGRNYAGGVQPSWYTLWLNNSITDGTVYMGGPNSDELSGEAQIAVQGTDPRREPLTPMTLATVVRGNDLQADAHIEVSSAGFNQPFALVRDVVVEDNRVSNAKIGLIIGPHTEGVVSRNNTFTNCGTGIDMGAALLHEGDRFVNCGKAVIDASKSTVAGLSAP